MAAIREISPAAALVAVLSELRGIFTLKEEHENRIEGFGESSVKDKALCFQPT